MSGVKINTIPEMLTVEQIRAELREAVSAAGGAVKWLRKHNLTSRYRHVPHMVEDGRIAADDCVLKALGYRKVQAFARIEA